MRYFRIVSLQLPRCKVALQSPSFSLSSLLKISPLSLFESKESFRKPKITSSSLQSWKNSNFSREYTSTSQDSKPAPSDRVSAIVDEISALTLLEASDLTEILRKKLDIKEMPVMAVMMPGMGIGIRGPKGGPSAKVEEKKAEKTAFDVKLEAFDASGKIKVIKEVRTFTNLGLKEAKDLVEKTPTLLKKGVTKEEAEKIIEKMKEVGAKVTME